NCHSGTAYEVITTPGDPNTFLSCGEDGTVRVFDVRTKSKCSKRDCKEDILIECGKAVTSVSINPLAPYQLGIGCEDSTVALFDRRSLSTAGSSSGSSGMAGLTYKFKPEALKDRTCRVTSLQYRNSDAIVRTNEQMLEESRDTITVPASFMLRMLASLNHARLGRNQDDSETDSNDSD
ncbi:DDB1- and CUL4-associated factor 6, partial [Exaiptasia diaphana]